MVSPPEHVTVLTPRFPLPLTSGTQLREYHSLRALADRFDVTLVSLVQEGEGNERVEDIEALGVDVRTVPHSRSKKEAAVRTVLGTPYRVAKFSIPSFRDAVRAILSNGQTDLVWVHFLSTIPLLPPDLDAPVVLDQHNADFRYWRSFADGSVVDSAFSWLNRRWIRRLQRRVRDRIDIAISVSERDAEVTRQWLDAPVVVVPNGVDTERFSPEHLASERADEIIFIGSLDVRMNEEAVVWFVESAWDDVRREQPNARFSIVGKNPSRRVRELDDYEGVTVVGEVPDVVDYYEQTAVVVAPFRYGGGSKLKVLEALSMARPLVTTETGAVGINVVDGDHAMIRDRGRGFTDAVVKLLQTPSLRDRIGQQGRAFVREQYSWGGNMQSGINRVLELADTSEP